MGNSDTECDVCHEKTVHPYLEHALGRADYLCAFCFTVVFYDLIFIDEMVRRKSLKRRYEAVS